MTNPTPDFQRGYEFGRVEAEQQNDMRDAFTVGFIFGALAAVVFIATLVFLTR